MLFTSGKRGILQTVDLYKKGKAKGFSFFAYSGMISFNASIVLS